MTDRSYILAKVILIICFRHFLAKYEVLLWTNFGFRLHKNSQNLKKNFQKF